jgi:hypothetical protein
MLYEMIKYFPYTVMNIIPMYGGIGWIIYTSMQHMGKYEFLVGLYICLGAIVYGKVMNKINSLS